MSKRRAVILAVTVEQLSQAEAARLFNLSESTVSRWLARYRDEGDAAFEARSRRPRTSPTATDPGVVERIVNLRLELDRQGLDAGPHTIAWHLATHHQVTVSVSTIRRRLLAAGLITPEPKKRPRSAYIRFEADLPNECWQADFTHWRLADRTDVEILTWLDDHSRYALSVTAHRPSPEPSWSTPSSTPPLNRDFPLRCSPTTAWSSPPASPAAEAAETASRPPWPTSASNNVTPAPTTPPPAARSNGSNRP
jgi:transposase